MFVAESVVWSMALEMQTVIYMTSRAIIDVPQSPLALITSVVYDRLPILIASDGDLELNTVKSSGFQVGTQVGNFYALRLLTLGLLRDQATLRGKLKVKRCKRVRMPLLNININFTKILTSRDLIVEEY